MRFAYIDSNGNEVPIPSVDALALRIELGAIHASTELYDAQADQWGPAHEHEIFHALARAAEDEHRAFAAPLPPFPLTRAASEAATGVVAEATAIETLPEPEVDPVTRLTLAEPMPVEKLEGQAPGHDPPHSLDRGDLDRMEAGARHAAATDGGGAMGSGERGGFGAGLEHSMEFSAEGAEPFDPGSQGLELDQPMPDFTTRASPAWMEPQDLEGPPEDVMDFSAVGDAAVEQPSTAAAAKRPAGRRRSSRRLKRQRSLVGPIVSTVVLAALAVGAYVAWPIVSARFEQERGPTASQAAPPPVSDELAPQLRSAADAAFASTLREARAGVQGSSPRPPESWLAGVYLANASEFGAVEEFWLSIGDELDALRGVDRATFMAAFERALPAGVSDEHRQVLVARAESGFDAASQARERTYGQVDSVVDAALGLHDFLLANQGDIEYTPASSGTADPVLEARPATERIGDALEDHLARLTDALDELDYLDRVTADGLWAAVLERIQEVGIR